MSLLSDQIADVSTIESRPKSSLISTSIEVHEQNFDIECDSHFIERALSHYMNHANKYGGGTIKIEAKCDDSHFTLSAHDNGEDFKLVAFDTFPREGDR